MQTLLTELLLTHGTASDQVRNEILARIGQRRNEGGWQYCPIHSDFEAIFRHGAVFREEPTVPRKDYIEKRILVAPTTDLVLPTGRIVACEPGTTDWEFPFEKSTSPGKYPIFMSFADYGCIWPVAAKVQFRKKLCDHWEPAFWKSPSSDRGYCYTVEGGTGSFFDEAIHLRVRDYFDKLMSGEIISDFHHRSGETPESNWESIVLDSATEANYFRFMTGGDGGQCSYWGLDDRGDIAALVTDINPIMGDVIEVFRVPKIFEKAPCEIRHALLDAAGIILEVVPGKNTFRPNLTFGCFGTPSCSCYPEFEDESGKPIRSESEWPLSGTLDDGGFFPFAVMNFSLPAGTKKSAVLKGIRRERVPLKPFETRD